MTAAAVTALEQLVLVLHLLLLLVVVVLPLRLLLPERHLLGQLLQHPNRVPACSVGLPAASMI
jgi:hypothetical protein